MDLNSYYSKGLLNKSAATAKYFSLRPFAARFSYRDDAAGLFKIVVTNKATAT